MDKSRPAAGHYEIGEYEDAVHAEVTEDLRIGEHGYKYRLVDGVVMPPYITPSRYQLMRTLQTLPGDICYTSYPKSGSTWLAYILVLIVHRGELPAVATLRNCLHWVESSWSYPRSREELDALAPPRIFKSHMPFHMALGGNPTGNQCRYVYMARNPKDVAVSYYYFESGKSWSGGYSGPWEHWLDLFMSGRVQRGDWFDHVLGWWQAREAENILFLKYEDLLRDFDQQVGRLADFLQQPLSEPVLRKIRERSSFETMKRTDFSNMHEIKEFEGFFRKGQIGAWKERFTAAQSEAFDRLCRTRLAGSELEFVFE